VISRLHKYNQTNVSLIFALRFFLTGLLDSQLFRKASNSPTLWARFTRREGRVSGEGCKFILTGSVSIYSDAHYRQRISHSRLFLTTFIVGNSGS
jgi:hypothetical protein